MFIGVITKQLLRYRLIVIAAYFILLLCAIIFIQAQFKFNTDTKDMLSSELDWRQADLRFESLFPQNKDTILIAIEAPTPDQTQDAATELYQKLQKNRSLFKDIYYPPALPYFKQSSLLFLEPNELVDMSNQLATIQPFIGTLVQSPTLIGLVNMLSAILETSKDNHDIEIIPLVSELNQALEGISTGSDYVVSWQNLIIGQSDTQKIYREFIIAKPILDYALIYPATEAIQHIKQHSTNMAKTYGAKVRMSGSVALSHEELHSVAKANWQVIILSLILVTSLLVIGLGSISTVLACIITLISGLVLTTAFAIATVGSFNLISIVFAVLYIGLGIDFAIHYSLRYGETITVSNSHLEALINASKGIFRSLGLCAITTAMSFFAFILTDYHGIAELGWIAGSGMLISLIVSFTLLPALLFYTQPKKLKSFLPKLIIDWLRQAPFRHYQAIIIITVIAWLLVLPNIDSLNFDGDPLNLQDQTNESVQLYKTLISNSNISPWGITSLARDETEARGRVEAFKQLDSVSHVTWLGDLIPNGQDEKLYLIEEMAWLLGDMSIDSAELAYSTDSAEKLAALTRLQKKIDALNAPTFQLVMLENTLSKTLAMINQKNVAINQVETVLMSSFPGRIKQLNNALSATPVTLEALPDRLKNRWLASTVYQVNVSPKYDLSNPKRLTEFVEQTRRVDPNVIGVPVINIEATETVKKAFKTAFLYAFIAIVLLLSLIIREPMKITFLLIAMLSGIILTIGLMLFFKLSLNFANITALPLILGIGVDSGIHILERYRQARKKLFETTTSRGVVISGLTTILGISGLVFTPHAGTASMGMLLIMGIFSILCCMLFLLPALLSYSSPK